MKELLSILIPVRDEEINVNIISNEIIKNISHQNYEIVFINDYSLDKTENELIKLKSSNNKIVYFNNEKKGLGGAIDLGIQKSQGEYVCIMMSDSSDTVEDLNCYYDVISSNNLDAVFGSRFVKGGKTVNYPLLKMVLNRLGNLLAKFLIWSDLNDFTNGFKIYRKDVLIKLYPLVSESFNIFFELPLKTIIRGFRYKVIPISYYNRTVGEAKFKIDELGSKYIFTLLYCFLEKILLNTKVK
jgi:dolichol-phosphate mannosyltransferase|tara:strand:+ start:4149 stop:4874 length:726 start_codon:yes stop_codon:yes gene_type:complete